MSARAFITAEAARRACLAKPGAFLDRPFGPGTLVFKVGRRGAGRMFALMPASGDPLEISLKCDPELAVALRSRYPAVRPGYHLNKRHWNTIRLDGSVPDAHLAELIELSYVLVVRKLDAAARAVLTGSG